MATQRERRTDSDGFWRKKKKKEEEKIEMGEGGCKSDGEK